MSYISKNLSPGERILYETRPHWIVLLRSIVADTIFTAGGAALLYWAVAGKHTERGESQTAGMAAMALIFFGGIILSIAVLRRGATEIAVTNKRVIIKVGLLTKRTIELFLSRVESIGVEQTVLGRMLGYGDITVRGTGGTCEPFSRVAQPLELRRQVQQMIEEHTSPSLDKR
jgi:uncharacterized membrane protein YdbT with pleckstrin-like domain